MAFIQGVSLGNKETRDQEHGLTEAFKKGRTFFKAVGSFAKGSVKFATPLINILSNAGVFSEGTSTKSHIKKGVTLSITVIKTPNLIEKTFIGAKKAQKMKGADLAEEVVKTAAGISSIAVGLMSCFPLGETIVSLISAFSQTVGMGFKVVGEGISKAVPFVAVFSAFQIGKAVLDVGVESVKLYKTAKKISATTKKMKIWTEMDWNDPTYISKKLDRMKVKQIKTVESLEKLEGAAKASAIAFESRVLHVDYRWAKLQARKIELGDRNAIIRVFGQIVPQIKLSAALLKKEEAEKKHINDFKNLDKISAKHTLRTVKIRNFTVVEEKIKANTLNDRDRSALKHFQKAQVEKLKVKKSNLKVDVVEHSLKIGLKLIVVISLVACLALTFSGVGTMPGIITNASVALFVMVAEYGLKKFREFSPPNEWAPVKVPALLEESDEKIERKARALLSYSYSDQIKVNVTEGKMTLIGSVIDLSEREAIEKKLSTLDNVNEIDNQITKKEPI